MSNSSLLKNIYLFKDLTAAELEKVAQTAQEKEANAGQEIFMTGEQAKSFFVIVLGAVKISSTTESGDSISIASLGTGSHFGEVPFLDEGKRSATVQATEFTRLIEINFDKLRALSESDAGIGLKIYRSCARFLATRLRATLTDLNAAKEAKLKYF